MKGSVNITRPSTPSLRDVIRRRIKSSLILDEATYQKAMGMLSNLICQVQRLADGPHIVDHEEALNDMVEDLIAIRTELKELRSEAGEHQKEADRG